MRAEAEVRAQAESYYGGAGRVGVLLCHGFTGSPQSLREWAEHLERDGFRVALPRLPGHGTTWQDLNRTDWTDWYATVERSFRVLQGECEAVCLGGLSMGGALALRLAVQFGEQVAGIALVNPALRSTDLRLKALPVLRHPAGSTPRIANDIAMPGRNEGGYDRTSLQALHSLTQLWRQLRPLLPTIS